MRGKGQVLPLSGKVCLQKIPLLGNIFPEISPKKALWVGSLPQVEEKKGVAGRKKFFVARKSRIFAQKITTMQEIITYVLAGGAVFFLLWHFFFKKNKKSCGSAGCKCS